MRKTRWCAAIVASFPTCVFANGTLTFKSEPGDFVGAGLEITETFNSDDAWVMLDGDLLYFFKLSTYPKWTLALRASSDRDLDTACYERAQSIGLSEPRRPILDFGYDQRGCANLSGRFKVIELTTAPGTENVTSLAVDFVQQCEALGPALFGKLRYQSSIPLDTPPLVPAFASTGVLQFSSEPGDYVGQGAEATLPFDRPQFVTRVFDNAISAIYRSDPELTHRWSLSLAAPDTMPLVAGKYPNVERYPFQAAGHPGLDFSLENQACKYISGWFAVNHLVREPIERLPSMLDVTFEQHCDNAQPALHGNLSFTTSFQNGPLVDDVIYLDDFDEQPSWPLAWDCP